MNLVGNLGLDSTFVKAYIPSTDPTVSDWRLCYTGGFHQSPCPVTWSSLMNKLKLVELVVVVREVISFLGSKEALETYQQLDDWKLCTKSH